MSVTSTDQVQDPAATSEQDAAVEATMAEAFAEEDLSIPEDVPSADDPSSRANPRDLESAGFSLDEFAALLSKYDYNFKPGDIVNGTVFALESKGAMIDIAPRPRPSCRCKRSRSTASRARRCASTR